jgi:general secretion pathway protein B
MSYILNALRKSEQERQAKQPETITDQVLMPAPQKGRKTALLIGGLLAVNLLILPLLVWYLKKADDAPVEAQAPAQPLQKIALSNPQPAAIKPVDGETASKQKAEKELTAAAPSIEELAALKQAAEGKTAKQGQPDKSGNSAQAAPLPTATIQQGQPGKESRARRVHGELAARSLNHAEDEIDKNAEKKVEMVSADSQEIPLFKDLPYKFRSSAPRMSINVFMYAPNPEDRFVVLNMNKYKAGQMTKDAVEIKEIRPDGIVASFGGQVFRIERP